MQENGADEPQIQVAIARALERLHQADMDASTPPWEVMPTRAPASAAVQVEAPAAGTEVEAPARQPQARGGVSTRRTQRAEGNAHNVSVYVPNPIGLK